jgi:PhzF family phenazine biosynthesis protein
VKIHLVDAFTDKAFAGNPAAVVLLDQEPTDFDWMQSIGMEMNQAETAFVWPLSNETAVEGNAGWGLRWFTPKVEIRLCGHATLASAHILWQEGLVEADAEVRFFTPMAGHHLTCDKNTENGFIRMSFPAVAVEPAEIPEGLAEALGATPTHSARNKNGSLLLQFKSAQEIRSINPDFQAMQKATDDVVIVTALSDTPGLDVISRFFAPGKGIDEDSVTGSAHCIIGPWWSRPLKQKSMVCYQASNRGGILHIELEDDKVNISGNAVTVLNGDWIVESMRGD